MSVIGLHRCGGMIAERAVAMGMQGPVAMAVTGDALGPVMQQETGRRGVAVAAVTPARVPACPAARSHALPQNEQDRQQAQPGTE